MRARYTRVTHTVSAARPIASQVLGVGWCFCLRTANDRIDGWEKTVCYLIEGGASLLLLRACFIAEEATAQDPIDYALLSRALELTEIAALVLLSAIFVPLLISMYNSFVVGPPKGSPPHAALARPASARASFCRCSGIC
jgi:hypothetical protein